MSYGAALAGVFTDEVVFTREVLSFSAALLRLRRPVFSTSASAVPSLVRQHDEDELTCGFSAMTEVKDVFV